MADVDAAGAALVLGRSYSWFMRSWRKHRHPGTGAPIPPPFVGAGRGERPRWTLASLEAWKAGDVAASAQGGTGGYPAQREAANDARPRPATDRAAALLAAAGG